MVDTVKYYPFRTGVRERPKGGKCSLDSDTCMRQMRLVEKKVSMKQEERRQQERKMGGK